VLRLNLPWGGDYMLTFATVKALLGVTQDLVEVVLPGGLDICADAEAALDIYNECSSHRLPLTSTAGGDEDGFLEILTFVVARASSRLPLGGRTGVVPAKGDLVLRGVRILLRRAHFDEDAIQGWEESFPGRAHEYSMDPHGGGLLLADHIDKKWHGIRSAGLTAQCYVDTALPLISENNLREIELMNSPSADDSWIEELRGPTFGTGDEKMVRSLGPNHPVVRSMLQMKRDGRETEARIRRDRNARVRSFVGEWWPVTAIVTVLWGVPVMVRVGLGEGIVLVLSLLGFFFLIGETQPKK
jgi:hypothetical protein